MLGEESVFQNLFSFWHNSQALGNLETEKVGLAGSRVLAHTCLPQASQQAGHLRIILFLFLDTFWHVLYLFQNGVKSSAEVYETDYNFFFCLNLLLFKNVKTIRVLALNHREVGYF